MINRYPERFPREAAVRFFASITAFFVPVAVILFILDMILVPVYRMDSDVWWHLSFGRYIYDHGAIPSKDPLSFTSDIPLVPISWLFDLSIYALYNLCGLSALPIYPLLALSIACFFLVLRVRERLSGKLSGHIGSFLLLAWAGFLFSRHYSIRPHMLGWVFFSAVLLLLEKTRDNKMPPGYLGLLVPIAWIWIQIHGSYILLFGLCILYIIMESVKMAFISTGRGDGACRVEERQDFKRWIRICVICLAAAFVACFANPGGWRTITYFFPWIMPTLYRLSISEYRPPAHTYWFILTCLASLFVAARRLTKLDITGAMLNLIFTFMAFFSARHLPFLPIVFLPYIGEELDAVMGTVKRYAKECIIAVLILSSTISVYAAGQKIEVLSKRLPYFRPFAHWTYPWDCLDFIRMNKLPGPIFNMMEYGGHIEWRLYPDYPAFIDSRCDQVYSEEFYREYLTMLMNRSSKAGLLDEWKINLLLLNKGESRLRFIETLPGDGRWIKIYEDDYTLLYIRNNAGAREIIRRKLMMPETAGWYACQGKIRISKGQSEKAFHLLEKAIEIDPRHPIACLYMGYVLAQRGDVDRACVLWRIASYVDPYLKGPHFNLGVYAEKQGDRVAARREYEKELRLDPENRVVIERLRSL